MNSLNLLELYRDLKLNHKKDLGSIWGEFNNTSEIIQILNKTQDYVDFIKRIVNDTGYYGVNKNFLNNCSGKQKEDFYYEWVFKNKNFNKNLYDKFTKHQIDANEICFLRCINMLSSFAEEIPSANIILEIGAGYGQLARITQEHYKCKYIIIDIPVTILSGYTYLTLDNKKCQISKSPEHLNALLNDSETNFIFISCFDLNQYENLKIDLLINTASFCEIADGFVSDYMNFIQNKWDVKYFYSANNFLNTKNNKSSQFHFLFDEKWDVIKYEVEPWWSKCPYFDSWHTRFLELLLKRNEKSSIKKEEELEKILNTDYALSENFNGNMNDGFTHPFHGKDSITYLCWNYLRYDKSNHDIINLFIKILTKNGDVFEETAILKGMKNK